MSFPSIPAHQENSSKKSLLYGMSKLDEFVRFCSRIDLYGKLKEKQNPIFTNFLNDKILEVNVDQNLHLVTEKTESKYSSIDSVYCRLGQIEYSDQFIQNQLLSFTTFSPFRLYRNSVFLFRVNLSYWLNDFNWAQFQVWIVNLRSGNTMCSLHIFEDFQTFKEKIYSNFKGRLDVEWPRNLEVTTGYNINQMRRYLLECWLNRLFEESMSSHGLYDLLKGMFEIQKIL